MEPAGGRLKTKLSGPWYSDLGPSGICQLADRLEGLPMLREVADGATVLDLGCAEGLVSQWLVNAGAEHADGIDYSVDRVAAGNDFTGPEVCLRVGDLNDLDSLPDLRPSYDIVLCLGILQKLKRPEAAIGFAINRCRQWLAIRTPDPVIDDPRSDHRFISIIGIADEAGLELSSGWFGQDRRHWVGIFRRCT